MIYIRGVMLHPSMATQTSPPRAVARFPHEITWSRNGRDGRRRLCLRVYTAKTRESPKGGDAEAGEGGVDGKEGQPFGQTLGSQEAVERVAVGEGKCGDAVGVFRSDGDGRANA